MNQKLMVVWCVLSGLCGGGLVSFLSVGRVHAQAKHNVEQVVSAQKFDLVNTDGSTVGTFGLDSDGSAEITLMDSSGKVVWSTKPRMKSITR